MKNPDESIERENYEIINSLDNCQNCGAKMAEQSSLFSPPDEEMKDVAHEPYSQSILGNNFMF